MNKIDGWASGTAGSADIVSVVAVAELAIEGTVFGDWVGEERRWTIRYAKTSCVEREICGDCATRDAHRARACELAVEAGY